MFRSGRRPAKTRSEMFRDELGETFDHLKQAAAHGADTVSTAVRPRMTAARTVAIGTAAGAMARMAEARKQRAQQAAQAAGRMSPAMWRKRRQQEKAKRRRGRRLAGLLAIGTAVGAAGALVGRRRRRTTWEAYDTSVRPPQEPVEMSASADAPARPGTTGTSGSQSRQPMPGKGTRGVGPLSDQARRALSGATEPDAAEADVVSPGAQQTTNRRR